MSRLRWSSRGSVAFRISFSSVAGSGTVLFFTVRCSPLISNLGLPYDRQPVVLLQQQEHILSFNPNLLNNDDDNIKYKSVPEKKNQICKICQVEHSGSSKKCKG